MMKNRTFKAFKIREYVPSDWTTVCEIHDVARRNELKLTVGVKAFRNCESTYKEDLLFEGKVLVAEILSKVVGFIAYVADEVTWLYVDPNHARKGVATRLLQCAMIDMVKPVSVSVLDGNLPAINLYKKLGFCIVKTTSGALSGSESVPAVGHHMALY